MVGPRETSELVAEMKRRFPWLGTEDDAAEGADTVMELVDWYEELCKELGRGNA